MDNMMADQMARHLVDNLEYQSVEMMALEQEDQMAEKWEELTVVSMVGMLELWRVDKQVVQKVARLVHYLVEQMDVLMDELWVDTMVEWLVERTVDQMVGMQAVVRAHVLVDSKVLYSVGDLVRLMDKLKVVKQAYWMVGWLETMLVAPMVARKVELKANQLVVGLVVLQVKCLDIAMVEQMVIQTVELLVLTQEQKMADLSEAQQADWMVDWKAYQKVNYWADHLVDQMVAWLVENLVYLQVVLMDIVMVDLMAEKQGA